MGRFAVDVIITEWALQSYLELVHAHVFSRAEYRAVIRPDVELLKAYPHPAKFALASFWGPATDKSGNAIHDGHKMKWHNLGPGRVQLRLGVALMGGRALLCRGYVKDSAATDKREMALLKRHMNLIARAQHSERGQL